MKDTQADKNHQLETSGEISNRKIILSVVSLAKSVNKCRWLEFARIEQTRWEKTRIIPRIVPIFKARLAF